MANTYTLISSQSLTGSAATVTFSSIPSTYTDLGIFVSGRGASAGGGTSGAWDNFTIKFNGSSTNYSSKWLNNTDNSMNSGTSSSLIYSFVDYSGATANMFGNVEFYIPNYASSKYKSVSADNGVTKNSTANVIGFTAGLWSDTTAINSITFTLATGSWATYSTFNVYGISNS